MIFKLTDLAARFLGDRQANGACSVVTDIKLAQGLPSSVHSARLAKSTRNRLR
jgi:hypothetical protein